MNNTELYDLLMSPGAQSAGPDAVMMTLGIIARGDGGPVRIRNLDLMALAGIKTQLHFRKTRKRAVECGLVRIDDYGDYGGAAEYVPIGLYTATGRTDIPPLKEYTTHSLPVNKRRKKKGVDIADGTYNAIHYSVVRDSQSGAAGGREAPAARSSENKPTSARSGDESVGSPSGEDERERVEGERSRQSEADASGDDKPVTTPEGASHARLEVVDE